MNSDYPGTLMPKHLRPFIKVNLKNGSTSSHNSEAGLTS